MSIQLPQNRREFLERPACGALAESGPLFCFDPGKTGKSISEGSARQVRQPEQKKQATDSPELTRVV
jgi:hypothetical protein